MSLSGTIAAISTAQGRGAIGIVRLSGPNSIRILSALFRPIGAITPERFQTRRLYLGEIHADRGTIDRAYACVMHAPRSYTGEDMVELHCHGNPNILRRVLLECIKEGARLADPGEFTRRAFLNGRMDLAQAESISDVIEARNEHELNKAIMALGGGYSREINEIRERILDVLSSLEAEIDFPEDLIGGMRIGGKVLRKQIDNVAEEIEKRIKGYTLREGGRARVAIVGKPNAGKSSLFNMLIGKESAIVTRWSGTTRDGKEAEIYIGDQCVLVSDTAGIRKARDEVEDQGIRKSDEAIRECHLAIMVLDLSRRISKQDREVYEKVKGKKIIVVYNKEDLTKRMDISQSRKIIKKGLRTFASAKTGRGIDKIRKNIASKLKGENMMAVKDGIVWRERHREHLKAALEGLRSAQEVLRRGGMEEIAALEVKKSAVEVSGILGEDVGDEVLDRIFSRFCIGK